MISLLLSYRRLTGLTMVLILLCPLLPALLKPVPLVAQVTPPPECLDDRGNALDPQLDNAWLLVLNFNHPLSTQVTTGCVVYRFAGQPQPDYRLIDCPLRNNLQGSKVGNGTAEFDGNFWIECMPPAGARGLKDFGIWATAHFAQPAAAYTLVDHPSVSLNAWINEDWWLHLDSGYGAATFGHANNAPSAGQQRLWQWRLRYHCAGPFLASRCAYQKHRPANLPGRS